MGQTAAQAGSDVAKTTKEQGQQVIAETGRQARDLYGQARSQVRDQFGVQQKRAAERLDSLRDEVSRMADQGGQSGPATQLARQASEKINQAARWLEGREPGDLLEEVKSFARRNPGTFLAGAALLGVVAGRLTKNMAGSSQSGRGWSGTRDAMRSTGSVRPVATRGIGSSGSTGGTELDEPYTAPTGATYGGAPPVVGEPYRDGATTRPSPGGLS